jgi:hypothetical protein
MTSYSFLWDGTEAGWVLLHISRWMSGLTATFDDGGPSPREIQALRRAVPSIGAMSASEAVGQLAGRKSVALGEFDDREGRRIAKELRDHGVQVQQQTIDRSGYLPFNELNQHVMAIEDDLVARDVTDEALRRGVPVRHVEA